MLLTYELFIRKVSTCPNDIYRIKFRATLIDVLDSVTNAIQQLYVSVIFFLCKSCPCYRIHEFTGKHYDILGNFLIGSNDIVKWNTLTQTQKGTGISFDLILN